MFSSASSTGSTVDACLAHLQATARPRRLHRGWRSKFWWPLESQGSARGLHFEQPLACFVGTIRKSRTRQPAGRSALCGSSLSTRRIRRRSPDSQTPEELERLSSTLATSRPWIEMAERDAIAAPSRTICRESGGKKRSGEPTSSGNVFANADRFQALPF